jgi:hypothetical protein
MPRLYRRHFGRCLFAAIAILACILIPAQTAQAQGCVASRQGTCMIGSHNSDMTVTGSPTGESWLSPRRWQVEADYRYFHSHRHFVGDVEQVERAEKRTEVNNVVHTLNFSATYDVNSRLNLTVGVPIFFSDRYSQSTPNQVTSANGVGDISIVARTWLLPNPSDSGQNISVGFGVKLPTGKSDVTDTVITANGPVTRVVDQSIQLGDGGYGMVADFQAYKAIKRTTLYASGTYLSNPRNTNGVPTGRGRASEAIMSVADQYAYRAGAVLPFPKWQSVVWSLGIRGEGVPSRDIIGDSDGFRRPGYIIAVDPGFIVSHGKSRWSFNVPVPFVRNRTRSVPDIRENRHGDAAFADYTIMVGYSRRF